MKRAIINVSIGSPYVQYQQRLKNSLAEMMPDVKALFWTDELPSGAKPHSESMYGFKMYAFEEAFRQGYDSVIWLDSPTVLHRNIDFVFDILESNLYGELVVSTESKLYQYCDERTIEHFQITRQYVKDMDWLLNYGFVFGFLSDSNTYQRMFDCERKGLFMTAEEDYIDHCTNSGKAFNSEYVEHRHEESIISMIVQSEGRKLIPLKKLKSCFSFEKTKL